MTKEMLEKLLNSLSDETLLKLGKMNETISQNDTLTVFSKSIDWVRENDPTVFDRLRLPGDIIDQITYTIIPEDNVIEYSAWKGSKIIKTVRDDININDEDEFDRFKYLLSIESDIK